MLYVLCIIIKVYNYFLTKRLYVCKEGERRMERGQEQDGEREERQMVQDLEEAGEKRAFIVNHLTNYL